MRPVSRPASEDGNILEHRHEGLGRRCSLVVAAPGPTCHCRSSRGGAQRAATSSAFIPPRAATPAHVGASHSKHEPYVTTPPALRDASRASPTPASDTNPHSNNASTRRCASELVPTASPAHDASTRQATAHRASRQWWRDAAQSAINSRRRAHDPSASCTTPASLNGPFAKRPVIVVGILQAQEETPHVRHRLP
jgi:hypothetical protein